ncbi:MAG TPA: HAMP domain-containing sensor histidine kinase [Patescibacteria group bacterium]|nr:HAMP domain-containing sensor histidine kinase [Patescibacteria group bacterium]
MGVSTLRPQAYVVNVFSLLAFVSLGLFGVLQITAEHNPHLGYLELAGAGAIALNSLGVRVTRNIPLARNLLLLTIVVFLMLMLLTGGTQNTGIFWFFAFPVSAFLLAGKKRGLYWMAALFGIAILMVLLSEFGVTTIPYDLVTVRQLLLSLSIVTAGIYAYQQARENAERQMRREQQEIDQAKSEFLTLASHQLRTPISAISWFSEMLLNGDAGKLGDTQREYVEQVYGSNQRSAAIVDAIILVSNLQAGTISTHAEPIDLGALFHRTIQEQLKRLPNVKELHIHEQYDPGLPKIRYDKVLVETIARNLVSNALKYTAKGGEITVALSRAPEAPEQWGSNGAVRIDVIDSGYGIPKAEQNKIFAKLFRASNIKAKDTDGTGLGLYIVKAILEQVGGHVSFESVENKGSTFSVVLPIDGMLKKEGGKRHDHA